MIMAEHKSDKSPYESSYGGGWITPAQKLAEIMCQKGAAETLPPFFWRQDNLATAFKKHIGQAKRLVDEFSYEAVFRALQHDKARKVTSFGAPFFKPIVADEQAKIDLQEEMRANAYIPEVVDVNSKPRKQQKNNNSLRGKLDGKKQEGGDN